MGSSPALPRSWTPSTSECLWDEGSGGKVWRWSGHHGAMSQGGAGLTPSVTPQAVPGSRGHTLGEYRQQDDGANTGGHKDAPSLRDGRCPDAHLHADEEGG